ncbi:hypothetical protein SAMN05880561_102618 [Rhizobium sp. RU33A]|uniref:hypothetical protein n=1 Tax=Rhizobium sp. RU33A TaxID=1907413 RepID=UPI000955F2E5|nr:hypothetical protein [Rhizobium sp. RU33A]SIQ29496.1 hypothetical protein SAMN05880561_102618 [Rhizobium sp. RU33A]
MVEDVNNLVLEHLRAIRADLRGMRDTRQEQGQRLTRMEIGLAGLRRDQGADVGGVAEMGVRLDRLVEQVRRIEHRLDLAD